MAKQVATKVVKEAPKGWLTLVQAARKLDFDYPGYVRELIKKGRLEGVKAPNDNGKTVWYINPETVAHYHENKGVFGQTGERAGVHTFKVKLLRESDTREDLEALLTEHYGAENYEIDRAYHPWKPKSKKATEASEEGVEDIVAKFAPDEDDEEDVGL